MGSKALSSPDSRNGGNQATLIIDKYCSENILYLKTRLIISLSI